MNDLSCFTYVADLITMPLGPRQRDEHFAEWRLRVIRVVSPSTEASSRPKPDLQTFHQPLVYRKNLLSSLSGEHLGRSPRR